ncbi:Uncharacterised protein [Escherichia coli]|nr:Uncharacterised protein [Escherichia coli]
MNFWQTVTLTLGVWTTLCHGITTTINSTINGISSANGVIYFNAKPTAKHSVYRYQCVANVDGVEVFRAPTALGTAIGSWHGTATDSTEQSVGTTVIEFTDQAIGRVTSHWETHLRCPRFPGQTRVVVQVLTGTPIESWSAGGFLVGATATPPRDRGKTAFAWSMETPSLTWSGTAADNLVLERNAWTDVLTTHTGTARVYISVEGIDRNDITINETEAWTTAGALVVPGSVIRCRSTMNRKTRAEGRMIVRVQVI